MSTERLSGRRTPYELVFGVEGIGEERFPAIAEEADRKGVETTRRDRFALLTEVGSLLQRLIPEDLDPAALDQYVEILFHCFHFWRAGCPIYALEAELIHELIERPPDLGSWRLQQPHPSLYFELPRHLFWAAVAGDRPPEPADGVFIRLDDGGGKSMADLLLVLGMLRDRPGFSVAGLSADLGGAPGHEPDAFGSDLPGAELAGIYSLGRPEEIVLLARRLLWYLDSYPNAAGSARRDAAGQAATADDLSTSLDYRLVHLVERERG